MSHEGEVRDFSRQNDAEGRSAAAEAIVQKRREYFDRKKSVSEQIASIKEAMEGNRAKLEEIDSELEAVSDGINQRKNSKLHEIANQFTLTGLRERLGLVKSKSEVGQMKKDELQKELDRNQQMLDELDSIMKDQTALVEARGELDNFYNHESEAYINHEKERQGRDVSNLIKEHNAFFFHGINVDAKEASRGNGVIDPNIPAEDRLKLLLALEPTVSASTIKRGMSLEQQSIWGRRGVLLSGGHVDAAGRGDIASVVVGLSERKLWHAGNRDLEDVSDAIENRGQGHNELIIREPKVAGYYLQVNADQEWPIPLSKTGRVEFEEAMALGLPLFIVIDGEVYPAMFSENEGEASLMPGPDPVSPEQLSQRQAAISPEQKQALEQEVLTDATFSPGKFEQRVPEVSFFLGARSVAPMLQRFEQPFHTDYGSTATDDDYRAWFTAARERGSYIAPQTGDEIPIGNMTDADYARMSQEYWAAHRVYNGFDFLMVGGTGWSQKEQKLFMKSVDDVPAFLEASIAGSSITNFDMNQSAESLGQNGEQMLKLYQEHARHIVGFCNQLADTLPAEAHAETIEKLRAIAARYVPREQYEEVKARRLDEKGRFKFSAEEVA